MADYGSVDPVVASNIARPQRTDRTKCPSALVYGTLLSLALAGVALKAAQLSAASPSGAADSSSPPRQFAAALPGQDDDQAKPDDDAGAVNASASPWVVHDVNLRAHEDVREFLRSQGVNASAEHETILDYVPRLEVRCADSRNAGSTPISIAIQIQDTQFLYFPSRRLFYFLITATYVWHQVPSCLISRVVSEVA